MKREKYLVTSALPYANGHLHIGHVAGAYLPADIFVRFQKLLGNDVIYISGTDENGAPISIKAEAEGKTPREIVDYYHDSIVKSFQNLEIDFDNFSGTARPVHTAISQKFFLSLLNAGFVIQKTTQQHYCEHDKRFLADRYIEGTCPYCGAKGARGDQCDACGKLIDAT
ncbi:MAG: class I tRNA ligase family protein, partial [Candidatus Cloacimonetes bacterium]|nr:class I tRNA ligase family protein [Candidatus Cloacimonadota bacterium]